ncbi:hypothetical protein MLD38_033922 [Melastoma candidum]|uniref:Uncharacterized protein n=1 Tax=Melastoma candidum TaxID=119954 RepID=A0ACB9MA55_9MYRT|nr:hypothetical protein MLD38_033922 [Melastoma candidum]
MKEAKARLHDIIMSGANTSYYDTENNSEYPWMEDGVGVPPNASDLLRDVAKLTKKVTEQVKILAKDEDEKLIETSGNNEILPYDQAKAFGRSSIDGNRIAAGLPCGSEGFLLMFARWRKLERGLYNERKERFDMTQIPDVYDSCKYDLLHNSHLNLDGLSELFKVARLLADGVIPNEYGINPKQKLKIGSKVARCLLGKILIDMRNTREEAICIAALKSKQDLSPKSRETSNESQDSWNQGFMKHTASSEKVPEDDNDKEIK